MRTRHAVFLILTDESGRRGIGESWVNFPAWAPMERLAAFEQGIIPYLTNRHVSDVPVFISKMYKDFHGPALQSGTVATLIQALCAVELALWDLEAQNCRIPLAQCLFEQPRADVQVYASGINSPIPWNLIDEHLEIGVSLFKLKLGFGDDEDRRNVDALAKHLNGNAAFAVDVNRSWTFDQAQRWLPFLKDHDVRWLEEPLVADEESQLERLSAASGLPIAGGENVLMPPGFDANDARSLPFDILQPDLTKNAPVHVGKRVLDAVGQSDKRIIPHFLGSAPGQAVSLHFAAGCPDGLVEMDINRNPLRTDLFTEPFEIVDGRIPIPDAPGIGWRLKE